MEKKITEVIKTVSPWQDAKHTDGNGDLWLGHEVSNKILGAIEEIFDFHFVLVKTKFPAE